MLPQSPQPKRPPGLSSRRFRAGLSILEVFIALAVLGTVSAGVYVGFNEVNAYSVSSRLYSEAHAVAQNQIDVILSKGPFNVTSTPYRVPPELALTTEPNGAPKTTVKPNVFVYTDPVSGKVVVTGTMSTRITNLPIQQTYPVSSPSVTSPLNIRRATVTVSYTFRNKPYNVVLETLRTADQ